MCSAKAKHSFRIDDILKPHKHDNYKAETSHNSEPKSDQTNKGENSNNNNVNKTRPQFVQTDKSKRCHVHIESVSSKHAAETLVQTNQRYNSTSKANEMNMSELQNIRIPPLHPTYHERRYPTIPLMPTSIKPELPWNCEPMLKPTFPPLDSRSWFNFFSDSLPNPDQPMFLRNGLWPLARRYPSPCARYMAGPCSPHGVDRGYWASYLGYLPTLAKRKGGQVRFTTHQTNTLERRFAGNKYLSPEDRRLLAEQLKLSDRQVKTWFQNRRAKWRRTNVSDEKTDPEIEDISDDEEDPSVISKMLPLERR